MKPYFGKAVIERPRSGSSIRNYKIRSYGRIVRTADGYDYEGLTRIPSRRTDKELSDVLGPLANYLRTSCGRLWDDVYSEIARVIGRAAGYGVQHILKAHVDVAKCTYRGVDGNVYCCDKDGVSKVTKSYGYDFYVEPETGILRQIANYRKWRPSKTKEEIREERDVRALGDGKEYRRINGIWYYQEFFIVEVRQPVYVGQRLIRYAVDFERTVTLKRQLGKKELRDGGLKF